MSDASPSRITVYVSMDSPFAHRVTYALHEAKIPYHPIWIDLYDKPDWYGQKVYPGVAEIPYLVHGGPELHEDEKPAPGTVRIPESLIILEYLADVFPKSGLLPTDPALRAKARLFIHAVETKFIPAYVDFIFKGVPAPTILDAAEAIQSLFPAEGFVVGEWSIADAALAPLFLRLDTLLKHGMGFYDESAGKEAYAALHSERFTRIQRWLADNMARPSMRQTWDEETYVEKFAPRIERGRRTGTFAPGLHVRKT